MNANLVRWGPFLREDGHTPEPAGLLLKERCLLNDFGLVKEFPFTNNMYTAKMEDKEVSALAITIKVVRKSTYYIINVAMVMFFIISFVFCAWAIHPGDVEGRTGVDFNLILTVVAFKIFLGGMLPAVSYVSRLDIYVMVGFIFLSAITVLHTIIPYTEFTKIQMSAITEPPQSMPGCSDAEADLSCTEEKLIDRDAMCLFVCAALWGAWNIIFTLWLWFSGRQEYTAFWKKAREDQRKYDECSMELIVANEEYHEPDKSL
jgi:hypothetical protein